MVIGRVISKSSSLEPNSRSANRSDFEQNEIENKIDISGWKIFAGITITTLASAIITLLTFFFINIPNSNLERNFERSNMQFQLLAYALQSKDSTIRKNSLTLLINAGLLYDEDGKIGNMIIEGKIPDWSKYKTAILYRWSENSIKKDTQTSGQSTTSDKKEDVKDDDGDTSPVNPDKK